MTERINPQIATGHDTLGNCKKKSKYSHPNAAYTLYTTPDEYAKFIIKIMKRHNSDQYSLSNEMIREMLKHQIRADVREVVDRPGRIYLACLHTGVWAGGLIPLLTGDIVYHSGSNQTGFRCYSQYNMREGSGIVIMTNGENGRELWTRLISLVGDL